MNILSLLIGATINKKRKGKQLTCMFACLRDILLRQAIHRWVNQEVKMTVKDIAKQVIDTLPNKVSMDDIIHALYISTKFEHGERQIREGKGISHEDAKLRLQKWVK